MKRLFALFIFLPVYGIGQNVVFNPGFDMTPWDTGWTIETDTSTSGPPSQGGYAIAIVEVKADTGRSLPNCCYLKSYVALDSPHWGAGWANAKAMVTQYFNATEGCTLKAQIKCYGKFNLMPYDDKIAIEACINNQWQTIWDTVPEGGGDTVVWSEISIGINETITGIRFRSFCGLNEISFTGFYRIELRFWVDDICVSEIGVEESEKLKVKREELAVWPNPFLYYTEVRNQRSEVNLRVYDMSGKLVEETTENIIGEKLSPGVYFLKIKGYDHPAKIIKLWR